AGVGSRGCGDGEAGDATVGENVESDVRRRARSRIYREVIRCIANEIDWPEKRPPVDVAARECVWRRHTLHVACVDARALRIVARIKTRSDDDTAHEAR